MNISKEMSRNKGAHEIRMPGKVLDEIRNKEQSGGYGNDPRFARKRKIHGKPVSRKEKRKEERQLKKQKHLKSEGHIHNHHQQQHVSKSCRLSNSRPEKQSLSQSKDKHNEKHPADSIAALKALKAKKRKTAVENEPEWKIVRESDLESDADDFGGFSVDETSENGSTIRIVKEDDLEGDDNSRDFDDDSEDGNENANTDLERLKQEKMNAKNAQSESDSEDELSFDDDISENDFDSDFPEEEEEEDPLAELKALQEAKKKAANNNLKNEKPLKKEKVIEATFSEDIVDRDMEYYAKKLGLKNGKKAKLTKLDDDDVIGGLLDGLDLEFSDEDNKEGSEDSAGISEASDDDFSADFSDDGSDSDTHTHTKENPFVAPILNQESDTETSNEQSKPSKYIPPAMLRQLALEMSGVSADTLALQKAIKGPVNKLSEANIGTIANEINALFLTNPRQAVNENVTKIIMDSVVQQGRLLDTFVYLHSALVVAIYRVQGVDFGAHFIQTLVEKLEAGRADPKKAEKAHNMALLLSSVYTFQLVSSKLLYDVIRALVQDISEANAELLLKIIRTSGNQMRTDDPGALKEIVLQVNTSASVVSKVNPRTQYLIDTIASLKNNKLKLENETSHRLTVHLKKFLGTYTVGKSPDPLQVTLEDILNVDTKGKWWLVGSAWKGADAGTEAQSLANIAMVNDILDSAEPNWLELAKAQRMNTDIRRAIFISIMSANDYLDAVTKLNKLALKKTQEREIPRIVVHCAVVEPAWNDYYGILACKLCDSHSYRKTFQFMLWDLVKGFDGENEDDDEDDDGHTFTGFDDSESDDEKLKKIFNLGRLFGHLFAEGSLALHALRTVNFVSSSADIRLFMEVLLVTFLDQVAKKSQVNSIGVGLLKKRGMMSEQKFDDRTLIEKLLKAKNEPALLKGLSHFISRNLHSSDFVTGRKQRKRVDWGVKAMTDVLEEIIKEDEF